MSKIASSHGVFPYKLQNIIESLQKRSPTRRIVLILAL